MKNTFEAPELKTCEFSVEDVVTASVGGLIGEATGDGGNASYDDLFNKNN
ncbi:MAG: hypothetical protein IJP02_07375 [Oscillospiraceae bacterium]|nr:hypothetical protein [Oscillospiraceae bacterium]